MLTEELRILLEAKRKELILELNAIEILLGINEGKKFFEDKKVEEIDVDEERFSELMDDQYKINYRFKSKTESITWKDYIFNIIEVLKYNVRSHQVAEIIVKYNENIPPERAKQITSDRISELLKEGKVKAIKGNSRKIGYIYELIK